jgi:carbamoylphosphate synthase large subunit
LTAYGKEPMIPKFSNFTQIGNFSIPILGNNVEILDLLLNKKSFKFKMEEIGLGEYATKFYNFSNLEFPLVLKPGEGTFGNGIKIIHNWDELQHETKKNFPQKYHLSEFVEGKDEYSFYFLFNGTDFVLPPIVKEFKFKKEQHVKGSAGRGEQENEIILENLEQSSIYLAMKKILSELNYEGFGCSNFKMKGNQPKIFEINPRFCSGLARWKNERLVEWMHAWIEFKKGESKKKKIINFKEKKVI